MNGAVPLPVPAVYVLAGASGSGESTWARARFSPYQTISSDEVRTKVDEVFTMVAVAVEGRTRWSGSRSATAPRSGRSLGTGGCCSSAPMAGRQPSMSASWPGADYVAPRTTSEPAERLRIGYPVEILVEHRLEDRLRRGRTAEQGHRGP